MGAEGNIFQLPEGEDLRCRVFIDGQEVMFRETYRSKLEGEEMLQFLDAAGSGWIRDEIDNAVLDADEIG